MNLLFLAHLFCSLSVTSHIEMLLQILGDLETFRFAYSIKTILKTNMLNSKCVDHIDNKDYKMCSIIILNDIIYIYHIQATTYCVYKFMS